MPYDINETHDPNLKSWVESANDPGTDFPIQNLPFCRFITDDPQDTHVGVAIGDQIIDLFELDESEFALDARIQPFLRLNPYRLDAFASGEKAHAATSRVRHALTRILSWGAPGLRESAEWRGRIFKNPSDVAFLRVFDVPNYTDFYASIHHAATVGSMFRPDNALLPNYKWVPIGYHGRASSIVASGAEIRRPRGQTKQDDPAGGTVTPPMFGPCKMLDYEMEVGCFIGLGNELGRPIPIEEAEDHIFGLCLVNDWSARDMQKWEYQPLGPFLAKNFATTVSPYVVTMEALAPFRCPAMRRAEGDPAPLPYLASQRNEQAGGFDITLEVFIASKQMRDRGLSPMRLSKGSFRDMYWTLAQLVTHHSSNGCNLQPGDLLASGTVSGEAAGSRGCLLELTWQGRDAAGKALPRKPIDLPTGEKRLFLEDGDEVIMKGSCEHEGFRRIGFGECRGIIKAAE